MVDLPTVCCMCGDVGFPEKLFRCGKCHYRSQHSYCSNYYDQAGSAVAGSVCDWCQSQERSTGTTVTAKHGGYSKRGKDAGAGSRSEYSGDTRVKQQEREESEGGGDHRGKNVISGTPSPRPAGGRRYKLLKDVLC